MLTVRELLRDLEVSVLTGEPNLDAPVRWVHISELADPTPWLSGGELLLTTGLSLSTADEQRAYVARLADHGLAGLGFGVGFGHEQVPEALVEAAAERDFPVIEIPYDTPFIAVTEKAFARLVNEQYALLQRSIAVQERLQRIVLSERGLDAIAAALATLIGGDGRDLRRPRRATGAATSSGASCPTTRWPPIGAELRERARRTEARGFVPSHPELAPRALALPIAGAETTGLPQAWLVAVKDSGGLSEFDRVVLHQAVTVVALELLRRHVASSTERRLAGDVLSELVNGAVAGSDLTRRLEPFGLGGRVTALVLLPPPRTGGKGGGLEACEAALAGALRDEAVSGLVATANTHVCALLPGFLDEELFELSQRVLDRVVSKMGTVPAAGAGRAVPPATRVVPTTRRAARWRHARSAGRSAPPRPMATARAPPTRSRRSRPTATSAPSSCCCPCRTPTRCGCSASRCSARSSRARATTAAS